MDTPQLFLKPGEFLLPGGDVDWTAWACVACDQFTSQQEYWQQVEMLVGQKPSTYKLILPECYLDQAARRIPALHQEMERYLAQGLVESKVKEGFILTERSTGNGARVGLVVLIDLEGYDYRPDSKTLIRATEGTILERIAPRLRVRQDAALEMSHVLMLLDDPMDSVVEPIYQKRDALAKLYDFPLMMDGGHVTGYAVTEPADIQAVLTALGTLRAQLKEEKPLLYAVGDGNHSLAAAKACWEELKPRLSPAQQEGHPARFALVELENIHDDALVFEPIHRVVAGYDGDDLLDDWETYAQNHGMNLAGEQGGQEIRCVYEGKEVTLGVEGSPQRLAVGILQAFLDDWLPLHPSAGLDYVHGEDAVRVLAAQADMVGFLLPKPEKSELFDTVRHQGVLPRKTFSLGEATEKRY